MPVPSSTSSARDRSLSILPTDKHADAPSGGFFSERPMREGFSGTGEFFRYWEQLHGYCSPERHVWVVGFEVVEEAKQATEGA
jgi:hypothetical protein